MTSLVGLEIEITNLSGKTKASQNQPGRNQKTVMDAIKADQPDSAFYQKMHDTLEDKD